ncbi:MAG TPA: restriction endonuclease [Verrucomicrobiota bacterium]|nr:hypothetical protein [Verrucomicrobiales bacterium]HRI12446.1 restriction endonuclease [Verrucomicrobiota bacterium]
MLPLSTLNQFGTKLEYFPRWGLVALAARSCLREPQIMTGFPSGYLTRSSQSPELFRRLSLIRAAETCAAAASAPTREIVTDARRSIIAAERRGNKSILAFQQPGFGAESISAADWVISAAGRPEEDEAKRDAVRAVVLTFGGARLASTQRAILRDVQTLHRAARQQAWTDNSPVPTEFFATHSDFTRELLLLGDSGVQIVTAFSRDLADYLLRNPQSLYALAPRHFEEFIAHMLERRGFQVELTLPTRDKGRDIIAIRSRTKPVKLLIECKRYHPENKVGIDIVQRLYGVVMDEGATQGIVATTSYFTGDAMVFLRRHPRKLDPKDFPRLVKWLQERDQNLLQTSVDQEC